VAVVAEVGGEVEGAALKERVRERSGSGAGDGCWEGGEAYSRGRGPGEREDGGEVRVHGVQGARGRTGARASACGGRWCGGAVVGCGAAVGWGRALGGEGAREGCALGWVGLKTTVLVERLRLWRVWDGLGGAVEREEG